MFEDLNGVWLLTAGGMLFGFLGVLLRYGFKTKCDQIDICWGFIKIHRDIQTEANIERTQIENGIDPEIDETSSNRTVESTPIDSNAAGNTKISEQSTINK